MWNVLLLVALHRLDEVNVSSITILSHVVLAVILISCLFHIKTKEADRLSRDTLIAKCVNST